MMSGKAMWFDDPVTGKAHFWIGLGTLVLRLNLYLLGSYSFGCHSLRAFDRPGRATNCPRPGGLPETYNCVTA